MCFFCDLSRAIMLLKLKYGKKFNQIKAGYHSHYKGPVSLMLLVMLLICLILSPGAALAQEVKPEDKVKVTVKADKTDLKDDERTKVTVTLDNESDDILKYNSLTAVLPDYFELHEGSLSHYEETIGVGESKSYSFVVEADADGHDDDRDKKEDKDKDSDKDDDKDKDKDKKEVVAKVVRRDSGNPKTGSAKSDTASTKATRTLSIDDYADLIMAMPTNLSISIKKGAMTNASGFIVRCDNLIPTAAKW